MEWHDNDPAIRMAEFDMAATLAGPFKSDLAKNPDGVCSRNDRKRRIHAVRRNVAMIGASRSSGRASSSK
jgi:hypothetical protein